MRVASQAVHSLKNLRWGLVTVVAGIAWLLAGRSMGDTDQGYMIGLAWRVFQGEAIYLDFEYVRPPLSPWLHSVWFHLGDGLDLYAARMWSFLAIGLIIGCQCAFITQAHTGFRARSWVLLLCFLVGIHNFPAMPWHTIDGLLFASLGLWAISKNAIWWQSLGWVAIFCAMLCKQSYYPMPLLALGWVALRRPIVARREILLGLMVLLGLATIIWWRWGEFWTLAQTGMAGASSFQDLWQVGVSGYLKPLVVAVCITGLKSWLVHRGYTKWDEWFIPGVIATLLGLWFAHTLVDGAYQEPPFRLGHILWWLALVEVGKLVWKKDPSGWDGLVLLGLSWCVSISWGYDTPLLGSLPLLWYVVSDKDRRCNTKGVVMIAMAAAVVLSVWRFPYRETFASAGTSAAITAHYPRLQWIKIGPEISEELLEIAAIRDTMRGKFTILPNWPHIHVLTHTTNPLPVDWAHHAEMHWERDQERYQQAIATCDFILLDKDLLHEADRPGRYGSQILRYVLDHWDLQQEGIHFLIMVQKGLSDPSSVFPLIPGLR